MKHLEDSNKKNKEEGSEAGGTPGFTDTEYPMTDTGSEDKDTATDKEAGKQTEVRV